MDCTDISAPPPIFSEPTETALVFSRRNIFSPLVNKWPWGFLQKPPAYTTLRSSLRCVARACRGLTSALSNPGHCLTSLDTLLLLDRLISVSTNGQLEYNAVMKNLRTSGRLWRLTLCLVLCIWFAGSLGCEKKTPAPRDIELHRQVHQQIIPEG